MGVIQRQGSKSTLVAYSFMLIGMLSNLVIYTGMLEIRELGIISFILTTGATFAPFLLLGFHVMFIRYFPKFEGDKQNLSRLYSLTFFGPILFTTLFLLAYLFTREAVTSYYFAKSGLVPVVIDLTVLVAGIVPFISIVNYVCNSLQRTAVPSLLNNLIKLVQPLLVVLYFYKWVQFEAVIISLVVFQVVLFVGFFVYQQSLLTIKLSFNIKDVFKLPEPQKLISYAAYGFAIGVGGALITNIDTFMVASLLGMEATGLYVWGLNIINAIIIPYAMLSSIAAPFISKYWTDNDMQSMNKLYKQSSSSLLLFCSALYFAVWLGLDDLYLLLPKGDQYAQTKYAVLILGAAKIVDVSTGFNGPIIAYSTRNKAFLWILGVTAAINIGLNFILIPLYGIEGAAAATLISFIIFNLIKYFFIKLAFNLSPFNLNFFYILFISVALFGLFYFLPNASDPLLNIAYKCVGFLTIYAVLIYSVKVSEDFNSLVNKILRIKK